GHGRVIFISGLAVIVRDSVVIGHAIVVRNAIIVRNAIVIGHAVVIGHAIVIGRPLVVRESRQVFGADINGPAAHCSSHAGLLKVYGGPVVRIDEKQPMSRIDAVVHGDAVEVHVSTVVCI